MTLLVGFFIYIVSLVLSLKYQHFVLYLDHIDEQKDRSILRHNGNNVANDNFIDVEKSLIEDEGNKVVTSEGSFTVVELKARTKLREIVVQQFYFCQMICGLELCALNIDLSKKGLTSVFALGANLY